MKCLIYIWTRNKQSEAHSITYNNSAEPFLSVIVQLMIGISIRNSDSGVRVYRVTLSGGGGRLPPLLLMVVELAMGQILITTLSQKITELHTARGVQLHTKKNFFSSAYTWIFCFTLPPLLYCTTLPSSPPTCCIG